MSIKDFIKNYQIRVLSTVLITLSFVIYEFMNLLHIHFYNTDIESLIKIFSLLIIFIPIFWFQFIKPKLIRILIVIFYGVIFVIYLMPMFLWSFPFAVDDFIKKNRIIVTKVRKLELNKYDAVIDFPGGIGGPFKENCIISDFGLFYSYKVVTAKVLK